MASEKYLRVCDIRHSGKRNETAAAQFYCVMRPTQRQSGKIVELKNALIREGYLTLNAQAAALGLARSTTWTIMRVNHKASGLSASVINRMLKAPQLPPSVREKIIEYVEEKRAGLYGHNKGQIERFATGLSLRLPGCTVTSTPLTR